MKKYTYFFFLILFCISFTGNSQEKKSSKELWTKTSLNSLNKQTKVHRSSQPSDFVLYKLDLQRLKNRLESAPMRGEMLAKNSPVKISFPNSNGEFETFAIIETPVMEEDLARKMSMIKAYAGQGINDPSATIRFTVTQFGLHTMTLSGTKRSWYIEPFTENRLNYIVYSKESLGIDMQEFECLTDQEVNLPSVSGMSENRATDDDKLRTFRLAQSCTGEYGAIFDGSGTVAQRKANVQAQMAITMTRVNGIYERDLAVTMIFVNNNDDIIYLNAGTDPWNNEWNTQTAITIDNVIGVNNYDIGHNFNTTGGGNAGCLFCVCTSVSQTGTHKGRGYTGRADPTGDPFDVDYVAHEMGHQFGGYHTMNSCSRSGGTYVDGIGSEVEPASGSTIMGYAGICSSNVQNNSDAYFHFVNIADITENLKNGPSNNCAVETTIGNPAPTADAGPNLIIPISTPYALTGISTDVGGTASHTYTWEQIDNEQRAQQSPLPTYNNGPLTRSFEGLTNPTRFIPRLQDLRTSNGSTTWEVLSSVSRDINFALTVRDNNAGGGQTADDFKTLTTTTSAGPFLVTSQNTASSWLQGETQTITWDVAGTTGNGVNTANVDILLSKDNGLTYPTVLAIATPNDGSHNITVPNGESANCRVMVRANGNVFFNINTANIAIAGSAAPTISYSTNSITINEGTDCNFTEIIVPLTISQSPSDAATANFSISGGSATDGLDFELVNSNVSFSTGVTTSQDLVINVFNDSFIEGDETITIDFSVNANSGNAVAGSNSLTLTITDDDIDPLTSGSLSTIFSDDFESGLGQWTVTGGATNFALYTNTSFPDAGFFNSDQSNTTQYVAVNDDDCDCDMSSERIASNNISLTGGVEYTITFDYAFDNQYANDTARLELSTDNQVSWPIGLDLPITATGTGQTAASSVPFTTATFNYTPLTNETTSFSILYGDATGWGQGFILDNFSISAPGVLAIQTAVNSSTDNNINLPSTGVAYSYDATSGDLMLNYNNINGFDYGCVDSSIDRAGLGAQSYMGTVSPTLVSDKVFNIQPTNTTLNTPTEVTFYFTKNEIEGWENVTGLSRSNLFAHREGSDDIIALSNTAYGTDVAFTGTFSGLSGVYYFGPEDAFRTSASVKVYLQGAAMSPFTGEETLMRDNLRVDGLIPLTSPYTDALTTTTNVLNTSGPNAIVDWILVELRDASDSTVILATQSALLQRDGDIVGVDGLSNLFFTVPSKQYYVAIKHRSHLGIMTLNPVTLSLNPTTVDFSDANNQITHGANAQTTSGLQSGVVGMWSGDVNNDGIIQYTGTNPDSPSILSEVLNDSGNFLNFTSYVVDGYSNNDIDMNSKTQFTGTTPDTPFILQNVFAHPENFLNFSSYQIIEQLPEN